MRNARRLGRVHAVDFEDRPPPDTAWSLVRGGGAWTAMNKISLFSHCKPTPSPDGQFCPKPTRPYLVVFATFCYRLSMSRRRNTPSTPAPRSPKEDGEVGETLNDVLAGTPPQPLPGNADLPRRHQPAFRGYLSEGRCGSWAPGVGCFEPDAVQGRPTGCQRCAEKCRHRNATCSLRKAQASKGAACGASMAACPGGGKGSAARQCARWTSQLTPRRDRCQADAPEAHHRQYHACAVGVERVRGCA